MIIGIEDGGRSAREDMMRRNANLGKWETSLSMNRGWTGNIWMPELKYRPVDWTDVV